MKLRIMTIFVLFIFLDMPHLSIVTAPKIIPSVIVDRGVCYSRQEVLENVGGQVRNILEQTENQDQGRENPNCGGGFWERVVVLNMSNPDQNCPSGWSLLTDPRSCTQTTTPGCALTTFSVEASFNSICGRILGEASGTNDAFQNWTSARSGFNYADGVNIFLSTPTPRHVWTFATDQSYSGLPRCPCSNTTNFPFPEFVGSNYFCDTHHSNNTRVWDGVGCTAATCCTYNNPPWFSVSFSSNYTANIDVRICTDEQADNERVSVLELELYVQ